MWWRLKIHFFFNGQVGWPNIVISSSGFFGAPKSSISSRRYGLHQWENDLGGSSCMVKNDGKGRKMTGFQRHQIIIVLMDISGPSRTSMAK